MKTQSFAWGAPSALWNTAYLGRTLGTLRRRYPAALVVLKG
jgi:hypothetical protein